MNIVLVNDYATVRGGTDQVAMAGARAVAEKGHQVHYFAPASSEASPLLDHPNIALDCLGQGDLIGGRNKVASALRGFWNRAAAAHLDKILQRYSPQDTVVHVHGWTKAVTTAVFPVIQRRGFQAIVTFHDFFVTCPNGAFFVFPTNQICHRVPLSPSCLGCQCDRRSYLQKLWRVGRQVVQKTFGNVPNGLQHAIIISRHLEAVLQPYLPQATTRYFVSNPIEVTMAPRVMAEQNRLTLYVGRLTAEKAPDHLAEATANLGLPVRFVGEGYLREKILGKNPAAEITGWMDRESIAAHFEAARVLVFPSIWHEGAPLTVGEALAKGIPVIVSDLCAGAEQVIEGVNGFLFRGGDISDLQEKLSRFSDSELVRRLSEGAHLRYWENPCSLDAHAKGLETVYTRVLAAQQTFSS